MEQAGENEFRNLAHSCREISNQLEYLSPTLGNVVNVLQTNQNIANVINDMRNEMNAGFRATNQRIDERIDQAERGLIRRITTVENRLTRRITTVENRLTRRITRLQANTNELKSLIKKNEKLSLIRSINSTCCRANSKIYWLKFRRLPFPHQVNSLRQLESLTDQQIEDILEYYELPRTANQDNNRKNLLNYIGVPNHLTE